MTNPHKMNAIAFSSEVDTGSREENASNKKARAQALIPSKPERLWNTDDGPGAILELDARNPSAGAGSAQPGGLGHDG
jgi:hypothetical protein